MVQKMSATAIYMYVGQKSLLTYRIVDYSGRAFFLKIALLFYALKTLENQVCSDGRGYG